jgi:phage-related minor tail protein
MATGPGLAMKMTADTVGISRGVTRTEKLLGELTKSTRQATSAMRGLVAIEVGKLLAGGLKSAANAIGGFVSSVRATAGEIGKLAQVSNASVNEFQRIAFAAQTVGIEQDKMADILKDVNDRVGDFHPDGRRPDGRLF